MRVCCHFLDSSPHPLYHKERPKIRDSHKQKWNTVQTPKLISKGIPFPPITRENLYFVRPRTREEIDALTTANDPGTVLPMFDPPYFCRVCGFEHSDIKQCLYRNEKKPCAICGDDMRIHLIPCEILEREKMADSDRTFRIKMRIREGHTGLEIIAPVYVGGGKFEFSQLALHFFAEMGREANPHTPKFTMEQVE